MRRVINFVVASGVALTLFAFPRGAAAEPLPADATVLIQGHGWGHGRGMGQWGARGMAESGDSYTDILTHYYSGITLGTRSGSETIRVLVESSPTVVVTSPEPYTAWNGGTQLATSDATYPYMRARYSGSSYVLEKSTAWNGTWLAVRTLAGPITFKPGSTLLHLIFDSGSVKVYRGLIEGRWSSVGTMYAINDLAMQHYLYGAVPREMPASWPAEGLKAQSVAARTYAAYKKDYARSKSYAYDICASTSCQVYGGYGSKSSPSAASITKLEYASTNAAVDATIGKVMLYGGKPILSEYSSSTGGHTAPGNTSYLAPVPDPADAVSPLHDWTTTLKVSDIETRWPAIGRLVDVRVTQRDGYGDWGGRVLSLDVIGTSSTVTMSGYSFYNAFSWPARSDGMYGNWFRVLTYKGELAATPIPPTVHSGSTATMVVLVKNTGTAPWPVGGDVRLATTAPSPFYGSGWISNTLPATILLNRSNRSKATVGPGEIADFRFVLHAESLRPSVYRQTFEVVNEGVGAISPRFTVDIPVHTVLVDEAPNLLSNGGFEDGITSWVPRGFSSGDGATTAEVRDGASNLTLGSGSKSVSQRVLFEGGTGRRFTLSGWSASTGTSASGGPISITAIARYTDGTSSSLTLSFPRATHTWLYDERPFTTTKPLSAVDVYASIASQTGRAYFDAVRLEENEIANPSFETGSRYWNSGRLESGDGIVVADARDGGRWLRLGSDGYARQTLPITGHATTRFRLSAWNSLDGAGLADPAPVLQAVFVNEDGTRSVQQVEFPATDHAWTYREAIVRAPKPFRAVILVAMRNGGGGSAGFDAIRFRQTWLFNSGFEESLDSWTHFGFGDGDGLVAIAREGEKGLKLTGSGRQGVYQNVPLRAGPNKRLLLSSYTKNVGTSGAGGTVTMLVVFRNLDGTATKAWLPMARTPHGWSYSEQAATSTKSFGGVDLYFFLDDQPGYSVFDGLRMTIA